MNPSFAESNTTPRRPSLFALSAGLRDLRDYSFITFFAERLFFLLQLLSPGTWLLGSRRRAHDHTASEEAWERLTKQRGNAIEVYVLGWAWLIAVSISFAGDASGGLRWVIIVLAAWRIVDVSQTAINVSLFDHLRVEKPHNVSGVTRTIVLSLWNYLEMIACFGILYASHPLWLRDNDSRAGPYYFSAINQLTIGYGDIRPVGFGRLLAVVQALVGLLFLVLVFARFVAFMPRIVSVQPRDRP